MVACRFRYIYSTSLLREEGWKVLSTCRPLGDGYTSAVSLAVIYRVWLANQHPIISEQLGVKELAQEHKKIIFYSMLHSTVALQNKTYTSTSWLQFTCTCKVYFKELFYQHIYFKSVAQTLYMYVRSHALSQFNLYVIFKLSSCQHFCSR